MKLTKENSFLPLTIIYAALLLGACHHVSERQMIFGRWKYMEVLDHDTSLFKLVDTDFIEFLEDGTFHYEIESIKKSSFGKWHYDHHVLTLKYQSPDTTMYFETEIISKQDYIFKEGSKRFSLKHLQ